MDATTLDELSAALLDALANESGDGGVSLPRLGKQLGVGVSVLMRGLSFMGDAPLGDTPGPGWVRLTREGDRWMAALTPQGRAFHAAHLAAL
jgi:FdhD protein